MTIALTLSEYPDPVCDELLVDSHFPAAKRFNCTPCDERLPANPEERKRVLRNVRTMNRYLTNMSQALKDNRQLARRTYVFPNPADHEIIAYYTVAMTSVNWTWKHPATRSGRVAAMHFDNLAVSKRFADRGLAHRIYRAVLRYAAFDSLPAARFLYGEAFSERLSFYIGGFVASTSPLIHVDGLAQAIQDATNTALQEDIDTKATEGVDDIRDWLRSARDASPLLKLTGAKFNYNQDRKPPDPPVLLTVFYSRLTPAEINAAVIQDNYVVCKRYGHYLRNVAIPFLIDIKKVRDMLQASNGAGP